MSLSIEELVAMKPIPGVILRDPVSGKPGLAKVSGDGVVAVNGTTFQAHVDADGIHVSASTITSELATAIAIAIGLIKDNADGTSLAEDSNSLKKISDALTSVKAMLTVFLQGEADGKDIDRLIELVAAIQANRDNIDALVADKVDKASIYNALDSTDSAKVLSAAQGKALKDLLDAMQATLDALHAHTNQTTVLDQLSAVDGKLKFNGTDVGETRNWTSIVSDVPAEWPAGVHPSGVLFYIPASVQA